MKVSFSEYSQAMADEPDTIGITLRVEYDGNVAEQRFIADDIEDEIGRVIGNLISQLAVLDKPGAGPDPVTRVDPADIARARTNWRKSIRA